MVHGPEVGAPDSSMRTLLIDHALFQLGGAAVIRTGGTISLVGGAAVGTQPGIQLRIRGGEVRLSDASWRIHTALVEFAARRGFRFTQEELRDVALDFPAAKDDLGTDSVRIPEERNDDLTDPGFGMIEFPA